MNVQESSWAANACERAAQRSPVGPSRGLAATHWNYIVRSGLISLKGTRRLLGPTSVSETPSPSY